MKILIDNGHGIDTKGKRSPDGDPDQEAAFYLLRHTNCPAVLTENLFMDNHEDCDFLLSKEGQQSLVDLHIDGIISYLGV